MAAIQAVHIRGYEERSSPKPHVVYRIEIQAHVRSWQMWRRYSEFDDLHTELAKAAGSPPPCALPPKHPFSILRSHTNSKILEERKTGLESYLRAIVSSKDERWRETFAFREFLGIPITRQGAPPLDNQFTVSSWMDEHNELQARIRDVRADINRREAFSDRGDVAASHKANVDAKTKLAGVVSRIGALEKGLQELGIHGISEGELQRRSDMVARLQDDHEKLLKMVTAARHASRHADASFSASSVAARVNVDSDRDALLGTGTANAFKPITRVFGAAEKQPQETEQTRPLDDQGLLMMQKGQMEQQDEQLAQLTTVLRRQRQLGEAIGSEIAYQIEMLDDLSNEVDRVGGKLNIANRQLNRLG